MLQYLWSEVSRMVQIIITWVKNEWRTLVRQHAPQWAQKSKVSLYKYHAEDVTNYAPIAKTLCTLDKKSKESLQKKFELAYFKLSFKKMAPLCELQAKHNVELETGYKNNQEYLMFIEYTANEQRILLNDKLKNAKYFSIQADRSRLCQ